METARIRASERYYAEPNAESEFLSKLCLLHGMDRVFERLFEVRGAIISLQKFLFGEPQEALVDIVLRHCFDARIKVHVNKVVY